MTTRDGIPRSPTETPRTARGRGSRREIALTLAFALVAVGAVAFVGCAWALVRRAPSNAVLSSTPSARAEQEEVWRSVDESAGYSFRLIRANLEAESRQR